MWEMNALKEYPNSEYRYRREEREERVNIWMGFMTDLAWKIDGEFSTYRTEDLRGFLRDFSLDQSDCSLP